ncbi:MAG: class I SAM-dependent methyltransferase [Chloroflexota bacterium]
MRQSAPAKDISYRLHDIDATTLLFRVKKGAPGPEQPGPRADIYTFLQSHPRSNMNDLWVNIPSIGFPGVEGYEKARKIVARMVDRGILETCGELPLEVVDARYERVDTCDLCGASTKNHPVLFWKHNTPMARCTGCGIIYANPRWKSEYLFGRYTPDYWEHYTELIKHTAIDPAANQRFYHAPLSFLEAARQTGRILDVGCASGEFLSAASARNWEVYGLEPSPIGSALAERVPGATIYTGTLDTAPWPDGWFDAVTLFEVIEHLQSPTAYVEKIARLVRPGGMFALTTPNIRSLAYRLLGTRWDPVGPNDHLYLFSPRTLESLLRDHGFVVHQMHTMATEAETWRRWLRHPALHRLAPALRAATLPVTSRLMLGDAVFLVARRVEE